MRPVSYGRPLPSLCLARVTIQGIKVHEACLTLNFPWITPWYHIPWLKRCHDCVVVTNSICGVRTDRNTNIFLSVSLIPIPKGLSSYFCQITTWYCFPLHCLGSKEGSHNYQECIEMKSPLCKALEGEREQRWALFPAFPVLDFPSQWVELLSVPHTCKCMHSCISCLPKAWLGLAGLD